MNGFLVGKIFINKSDRWIYSGTAFFINQNTAYTAYHCIEGIDNHDKIYIEIDNKKYTPIDIKIIEDLDFAKVIINDIIAHNNFKQLVTESMISIENLNCYGYKRVISQSGMEDIRGIPVAIEKYISEYDESDKSDNCFIIKYEEDRSGWKGFSGAPVFDNRGIWGIVLKHTGGDGIKTRLKVISFNKIINYIVDNKREDIIEDFPDEFTTSILNKRLVENNRMCVSLYHTCDYSHECKNINIITNFLRINDGVSITKLSNEIENLIMPYALALDKLHSNYTDFDNMSDIMKRIEIVKSNLKENYNSIYVVLWMMTEGLTKFPRIATALVESGDKYVEQDIYLKKENENITLLIPIISVYEDIFNSIIKILEKISVQKDNSLLDPLDIEWDKRAIDCLDIKSKVITGKLMRGEIIDGMNVDITALALYNSNIYSQIPPIINTEDKFKKFFSTEFSKSFNEEIQEYKDIKNRLDLISDVNINLFMLPVQDIQSIKI